MLSKICYPFFLVVILIFAGIGVQYIPAQPTDSNIQNACKAFVETEGYRPVYNGRFTDNYTDAVTLLISQSKPDAPSYKRFFTSPFYTTLDVETIDDAAYPVESLCQKYIRLHRVPYARYWHGYHVILRPLLYFMDYQHIRLINKYLQPALFILLLFLFWNYKLYGLMAGWVISYLILNPEAMSMSVTHSIVYYVASISTLVLLGCKDFISKHIGWPIFFLMIGIVTNFFDFLTYQVFALVIPLVVWFYLYPPKTFKEMVKNFVLLGFCWCAGYAGMWILRWVLSTLLTENNVLADAYDAVVHRGKSAMGGRSYPIGYAIYWTYVELVALYDEMLVVYSVLCASIVAILIYHKKCFKYIKKNYFVLLPFVGAALAVPMYCLIVKGHPIQHAPYVYRIWAAFFFAIISGLNFWLFKALEKDK